MSHLFPDIECTIYQELLILQNRVKFETLRPQERKACIQTLEAIRQQLEEE